MKTADSVLLSLFMEIMEDAISLTPPSPGLSATLLSNILHPTDPKDQKMQI